MFKKILPVILAAALFAAGDFLPAQEDQEFREYGDVQESQLTREEQEAWSPGRTRWYRSNSSGMTLEPIASGRAALRNEYCLSIEKASPDEIPALLYPYYSDLFLAELRRLYKNGKEFRRQWIFRDLNGLVRLSSSGSGSSFWGGIPRNDSDEENSEEESRSGFIEIRNEDGAIGREFRFEDDLSEWEYRFFYRENVLMRAETWFKKAPAADSSKSPAGDGEADNAGNPVFLPVYTDYYRYSRSGSIRAIDRLLHEAAGETLSRLVFPRIGSAIHPGEDLMSLGLAYTSDFLLDIYRTEGVTITYSLDSRGRILGEVWKGEEGTVLGEFRNTWSGDRLQSVHWKTEEEDRLVEYEYDDDGNRITERNYKKGVLERSMTSKDGRETEEIYMHGKLILRVLWEKGLKLSEERVFR